MHCAAYITNNTLMRKLIYYYHYFEMSNYLSLSKITIANIQLPHNRGEDIYHFNLVTWDIREEK